MDEARTPADDGVLRRISANRLTFIVSGRKTQNMRSDDRDLGHRRCGALAVASLDTLGNFYFVSTRRYYTLATIYSGQFSVASVGNIALVPGVSLQQAGEVNFDAEISADGQTLWFDDGQYSSGGMLAAVTGFVEAPSLSADGHLLYFHKMVNGVFVIYTVQR
jgi:hypothetical protein